METKGLIMPPFLAPLLTPILTGTASKVVRIVVYGVIALIVGLLLYSAFLKPTNSQHTTVQAGGTVNHYWEGSKVTTFALFGGCQNLDAEKYMKGIK